MEILKENLKADLALIISSETPLMSQLSKILGKLCTMYDFATIDKNDKYVTLKHNETGLIVNYTSEEKIVNSERNKIVQKQINSTYESTVNKEIIGKTPIPVSSTKELQSSGSKTLVADTSFVTGKEPQTSNYSIFDKSTGKTESLNIGDIALDKQSPETIKELLSGKQVKMTTKSGTSQTVGLSKTPGGWGLQIGKQAFNTLDSSAEA